MFNESDLNGRPETLLAICDEVIRRGLQVKFTGQLRIHKKCDRAFFQKLRQAGFVALRFGVDAFSENALRLQKKGYTTATVSQNLKDCWEAGIYTEVNWVIGVPGETDQDVEEGIQLILQNQPYVGRLANVNPLILSTGSVYWMEPEKHNIHFRGDKEQLYRDHPRAIPATLWYSTEPYVDEKVRKARFEQIVLALHEANFEVGAWAHRVIEDVKLERDAARGGSPEKAKLSSGVGSMKKPSAEASGAEAGAYKFRAGSALPQDRVYHFRADLYVVTAQGALYGIEAPAFEAAFGKKRRGSQSTEPRTIDVREHLPARFVATKAAVPELVQTIGRYNVVEYDGTYYGIPHLREAGQMLRIVARQLRENGFEQTWPGLRGVLVGGAKHAWRKAKGLARRILVRLKLRQPGPPPRREPERGPIPWGEVDVASLPGVVSGGNLADVIAAVEAAQGIVAAPERTASVQTQPATETRSRSVSLQTVEVTTCSTPRLVGSVAGYNVVEYEGWFYGLPQSLGEVQLEKVDVLETPGVIRDVSRDVVENEIRELTSAAPGAQP
jgi:hypothetical protein